MLKTFHLINFQFPNLTEDNFDKEPKTGEFGDNQYWTKPEMYDIDELLADMGNQ